MKKKKSAKVTTVYLYDRPLTANKRHATNDRATIESPISSKPVKKRPRSAIHRRVNKSSYTSHYHHWLKKHMKSDATFPSSTASVPLREIDKIIQPLENKIVKKKPHPPPTRSLKKSPPPPSSYQGRRSSLNHSLEMKDIIDNLWKRLDQTELKKQLKKNDEEQERLDSAIQKLESMVKHPPSPTPQHLRTIKKYNMDMKTSSPRSLSSHSFPSMSIDKSPPSPVLRSISPTLSFTKQSLLVTSPSHSPRKTAFSSSPRSPLALEPSAYMDHLSEFLSDQEDDDFHQSLRLVKDRDQHRKFKRRSVSASITVNEEKEASLIKEEARLAEIELRQERLYQLALTARSRLQKSVSSPPKQTSVSSPTRETYVDQMLKKKSSLSPIDKHVVIRDFSSSKKSPTPKKEMTKVKSKKKTKKKKKKKNDRKESRKKKQPVKKKLPESSTNQDSTYSPVFTPQEDISPDSSFFSPPSARVASILEELALFDSDSDDFDDPISPRDSIKNSLSDDDIEPQKRQLVPQHLPEYPTNSLHHSPL